MVKLSLAVPCYNEQDNVLMFYNTVKEAFDGKFSYEIIFVNDGSKDETEKRLEEIYEKKEENVKIVNFSRNFGKEAAVYAALLSSEGEYTCIIDADMQQRPETVLEMLSFLERNPDFDAAAAYQEKRIEGKILSLCKGAFYKIINGICETKFYPNASDFRVFRRNVLEAVLSLKETKRFSKGIFSWVGFKTHYLPYTASERNAGESKWNFSKLLKYAFGGIISYTVSPLRAIFPVGTFLTVGGLAWFIVMTVISAKNGLSDMYSLLLILSFITFMTGIILSAAGILGEYISRIFREDLNRPVYIEKSRFVCKKEEKRNMNE